MKIDCRTTRDATTYWAKRAYVDGEEVRDCFYVDTDEGIVGRYLRDADGRYQIDFDTMRPAEGWMFEANVELRDAYGQSPIVSIAGQVVGEAIRFEIT